MSNATKIANHTTPVFESYWHFAYERQQIWERRRLGFAEPWTRDVVLLRNRFTNAYRASDRVSQFLIREVIYRGDSGLDETFFRILLFKTFNRIRTWRLLESALGEMRWSEYSFSRYAKILDSAQKRGEPIFSAAYIMPSGKELFGFAEKHRNHLRLIEKMMSENVPDQLANCRSMKEGFEILLSCPTIGPFLAYQYVTDINYSEITNFSEMEFVVAGPGARSGLRKCFWCSNEVSTEDQIRYVVDVQEEEFAKRGLQFQDLWGRRLQLIDCQNLFCEIDKYARVVHPELGAPGGRTRIKQRFRPNPEPIDYWFPPKWGINGRITSPEYLLPVCVN